MYYHMLCKIVYYDYLNPIVTKHFPLVMLLEFYYISLKCDFGTGINQKQTNEC